MTGAYASASRSAIVTTLSLFRHFRAFLASSCTEMRDPFEVVAWRDGAARLTKAQAAHKLTWLVRIAILRKAGWIEDPHSREIAPAFNHRGIFQRYRTGDAQRHLAQIAARLNTPRLVVRDAELGEWSGYLLARIPYRITR